MSVRLEQVPAGDPELARLSHELGALGARAEGRRVPWPHGGASPEEVVVLGAQAARHDARLLWVVVELLARDYARFNPLALRRAALRARWPAAVAVALEFARRAAGSTELDDYARFVTAPIAPAPGERFFLGRDRPELSAKALAVRPGRSVRSAPVMLGADDATVVPNRRRRA